MNTPEDPWNRLTDHDRIRYEEMPPKDPDKFTRGEACCCMMFFVGVVGGTLVVIYKLVTAWLELP